MNEQIDAATDAQIGIVDTAAGPVRVVRADGTRETLGPGDPVYQGDQVVTGDGGSVGLTFADGSAFSLGEQGRMTLDEMVYDPQAQEGSSLFSVTKGVFVFVSGEIAKTGMDAMVVTTPVATIGVRGTKVAGRADEDGVENVITLLEEEGGHTGEIIVSTESGARVLNQAGQTVQVLSSMEAPTLPKVLDAADIDRAFGEVIKALPEGDRSADPRLNGQDVNGDGTVQQSEEVTPEDEALDAEEIAELDEMATDAGFEDGAPFGDPEAGRLEEDPLHDGGPGLGEIGLLLAETVGAVAIGLNLSVDAAILYTLEAIEQAGVDLAALGFTEDDLFRALEQGGILDPETHQAVVVDHVEEHDVTVFHGTSWDDYIEGTDGYDAVYAHEGDDEVVALDGDDHIEAGGGDDVVYGQGGDDVLVGESGEDLLIGGIGDDHLIGGDGADELYGGLDDDLLNGGAGHDMMNGDDGHDIMTGESGDDFLAGGGGDDEMYGGEGEDLLVGEDGDDFLFGDDGDDLLSGGSGDDYLAGGEDDDLLSGGEGDDALDGGVGDDELHGGHGDDDMYGDRGDDYLIGNEGHDVLAGGEGHDSLDGGSGDDLLVGEEGDDTLGGGHGDDMLTGGAGDDLIIGGAGADEMRGDGGADVFFFGAPEDGFNLLEDVFGNDNSSVATDIVWDFEQGTDAIALSKEAFGIEELIDGETFFRVGSLEELFYQEEEFNDGCVLGGPRLIVDAENNLYHDDGNGSYTVVAHVEGTESLGSSDIVMV